MADTNTHRLFGERIAETLEDAGFSPEWFIVEPGEDAKSWGVLEKLTDWLLALGITRSDHVFALGGGVVGDLSGLPAAITNAGAVCPGAHHPARSGRCSGGGKTAMNMRAGDLVGAFHQPAARARRPPVLDTLPARDARRLCRGARVRLLGDAAFFDWLEVNGSAVLAHDPGALAHAIATSIRAKARIVAEDERETTRRSRIAQSGAHIRTRAGGGNWLWRSATAWRGSGAGHGAGGAISARRGDMAPADAERAARAIAATGLPCEIADLGLDCDGARLVDHMRHDKKAEGATLPFLLMRGIGAAYLARDVDLRDVEAFLDQQLRRG